MMYKQVQINIVDKVKGNTSFEFDPMETVQTIKDKLQDLEKIAYDGFELKFGARKLEAEKTILESGLINNSTIIIEYYEFGVQVKKVSGAVIEIHVNPSETITIIKQRIAEKAGIDIDKFKLETVSGLNLTDESKTVYESGIRDHSTLKIVYYKITLTVTTSDNKLITFTVSPTVTVSHIKSIISQKSGFAMDRFKLQKGDGTDLDESKTLLQEGVEEGTTLIIIYYKINVTITITTPQGKVIVVTVDIMDTISTVKDRIKDKEGIDREKYFLKAGDEELDDGKTMDSIIKERKTIRIEFKTIKITVEGQHKIFTMSVLYADTISMIKDRIHMIDSTPIDRTELKFGPKVLKNSKTVS